MTQFRKYQYGDSSQVWFVEYKQEEEDESEWRDLFENPSELVCEIVVEALQQVNPKVVKGE